MSTAERCVRHIVENFPMFGFGNVESAILQCSKELLENSLDSLKELGPYVVSRGEVQINFRGEIYCDASEIG